MARLAIAVPLVIGLIFLLLYFTFGNLRQAALVVLAIPFAMSRWSRGVADRRTLSLGSGLRRIHALFGVAVLNGVVKISDLNELRQEGMPLHEAALGLMPLLLASGLGSEIQRPLATVVIGGLISSTALTL
ncbi:MAG: hypothetical protein LZF86_110522 [Nitrospira sp.]|nr:MAG: hypothetical protein LZF86_110522 [Nitrospira sp.]